MRPKQNLIRLEVLGWAVLTCLICWATPLSAQPPVDWQPVGQLDLQRIPESSGLVQSRRDPDIFWTHSDSGNSASLFAIRLDGSIVAEVAVEDTINSDWEDIAADNSGYLYIGDIGNNGGLFPTRFIHRVAEPKELNAKGISVKVEASYAYQFVGERFDSESLVVWQDDLFIIAKTTSTEADLYKLTKKNENWLTPMKVGVLPIPLATGADLSLDGKRLLVCTVNEAQWYEVGPDLLPLPDQPVHRISYPRSQIEACAVAGEWALFTNEKGRLFRVGLDQFESVIRRDSTGTTR